MYTIACGERLLPTRKNRQHCGGLWGRRNDKGASFLRGVNGLGGPSSRRYYTIENLYCNTRGHCNKKFTIAYMFISSDCCDTTREEMNFFMGNFDFEAYRKAWNRQNPDKAKLHRATTYLRFLSRLKEEAPELYREAVRRANA